jgi:putative FmdB family regulatory protein
MPTYDYECQGCGHKLEIFQSITESAKKKCPSCGKSKLARLIGPGAGFLFKGGGFYLTDYRSQSYKAGEKADAAPSESPTSAPDATKTESKSGEAAASDASKSATKSDASTSPSAKSDTARTSASKSAPKPKSDARSSKSTRKKGD